MLQESHTSSSSSFPIAYKPDITMDSKANTTPYDLPDNAVWFITGCSSGIGRSLAELVLAHPTHRLVATARSPAALSDLAGAAENADRLLKVALDVTSQAAIDAAVAAALARFGRVDVLVNNAGYGIMGDAEAMAREEERRQVETNFWGPAALCKHAVRVMRDENPKAAAGGKAGGVVLNVTSIGGFVGFPMHSLYHAAKFALEGYTEGMAKEMLPDWNIHFCIIEPGGVNTGFAASVNRGGRHPAYERPDGPGRTLETMVADPRAREMWARPEAVARAMFKVVADAGSGARGRIPIRLPLGVDAYAIIKRAVADVERDLEEFKELSISTQKAAGDDMEALA
ncbi:hypothetical protein GGTG_12324 [Gaeumannomyces tritici R3-111a-1]|uniref:Retinol dehydrogenase 8 n=1 Tax=Gaeumannomyces tritici (strain R3-111a-1) TaxID=644352 RepID=J3PFP9_GAET3|nr:hypothetical protein GGTG_12324 [Gaeumannomyces tritici R3-111a-1]EJT70151.1 hypothetical protein GGTG_12324 [Gaeumannomyces tritici R3-111a-1]